MATLLGGRASATVSETFLGLRSGEGGGRVAVSSTRASIGVVEGGAASTSASSWDDWSRVTTLPRDGSWKGETTKENYRSVLGVRIRLPVTR